MLNSQGKFKMKRTGLQVLDDNHLILTNNIIWTNEFEELLRKYRVLTETMIIEINEETTREGRNDRLLKLLRVTCSSSVNKFADVLYQSGHIFLSDHIRNYVSPSTEGLEVFRKIPSLERLLPKSVKDQLANFVQEKVKEEQIRLDWSPAGKDKVLTLQIREELVEKTTRHQEALGRKNKEVHEFKQDLTTERQRVHESNGIINDMKQKMEDLTRKKSTEIDNIHRALNAGENEIRRLKNRLTTFDGQIKNINRRIRKYFGEKEIEVDKEPENFRVSILQKNVDSLLFRLHMNDRRGKGPERNRPDTRATVALNSGNFERESLEGRNAFFSALCSMDDIVSTVDDTIDTLQGNKSVSRRSSSTKPLSITETAGVTSWKQITSKLFEKEKVLRRALLLLQNTENTNIYGSGPDSESPYDRSPGDVILPPISSAITKTTNITEQAMTNCGNMSPDVQPSPGTKHIHVSSDWAGVSSTRQTSRRPSIVKNVEIAFPFDAQFTK